MLFPGSRYAATASQNDSWCYPVLAFEESCEVRLIREAGALRDVGENRILGVEHATRALEAEMEQVLMRRQAESLAKRTREMRR